MWTDKCHKCGTNIFNGIPEEHRDRISEYIEERRKEGWMIEYKDREVGSFGHSNVVPIKPICTDCSQKESIAKDAKEMKKAMQKIISELEKVYVCPCCESSSYHGYDTKIFKSKSKEEMINHIKEKHNIIELKKITRDDF